MSDTLFIVAVIAAATAVAEWLGQQPGLHRVGGALMVILLGALMANLGVIPSASDAPPLYGLLISVGAPVSIFLLLLRVDLRALRRAGLPMLAAFALGAVGTVTGVLAAAQLPGADAWLGEFAAPLPGMYVATYVGGSANFNALALHYGLVGQGILFAGANAVDNVVTSLWMAALLVLPALLASWFPTRVSQLVEPSLSEEEATTSRAARPITLFSLAALLALALAAHWVSVRLAGWLAVGPGWNVPAILILTALALVAAQFRAVQRLPGALLLGTYGS
jgi:uncharacterized membrane protein